jgi:hypothetical protein
MRAATGRVRSRSGVALLAALLVACSEPSPPAPASPSTVDEIVDAHLAARGGKARLQALRAVRQTGTVTASDGRVARVVREIKRPNLFRLEFRYQGTTSVFAHDGESGWQVAPIEGKFEPEALPPDADAVAVDQGDVESPLVDWREKGHTVELIGQESLAGGDAWKLEVALAGGRTRYDYVDVASRQIVRSDVVRTVQGRPVELESTFSDFRDVSGIVFPHLIETHVKGRPQSLRITVQKIELDPELDDARFRMPG